MCGYHGRMAISPRDMRLLFQQSGGRCAFPACTKSLKSGASPEDRAIALSEVAHIVGQSVDGPRGNHPLPLDERDRYENLVLLCEEHHHIVDAQIQTFTVERLRQMKYDHEALIAETTRRAVESRAVAHPIALNVSELLHSSMLPVERLPEFVFSIPCDFAEKESAKVSGQITRPQDGEVVPFLLRGGRMFCFQDLTARRGPFRQLVGSRQVRREPAAAWWEDPNLMNWYVDLLNRTLNKITGRRGLNLDKEHRRYFFEQIEEGKAREVKYVPLNQATATRQVVWQPMTKKTGLPKKFWYHRAVALRFIKVSEGAWCLSMRPEMRVTRDGKISVQSARVGSRVTKKKSRMFNFDVLKEIQFWRDYLFESRPRLIASFGCGQAMVLSSQLASCQISWPGVPPERAESFKNTTYEETLFDFADLERLDDVDADDESELELADEEG